MLKKAGILILGFILSFITFRVPMKEMWFNSGFFEVYTFWILVLILFSYNFEKE